MTIEQTGDRLDQVEHTLSRVVVILEGGPVEDLSGRIVGTEGGIVQQHERHAEALHIIDHKLDGIQTQLSGRRWSRNQYLTVLGIAAATLVGSLPVWAF